MHGDRRQDPPEDTVDLLLCTHGTRDVCCGGPGTALFGEVVAALGGSDVEGPHGWCRIWRTAHAGGHRFAPTALSFPEGVSWAHLGASECTEVLCRGERTTELSRHMRGSVTVAAGVAQVADREGFARFGWDWLGSERKAVLAAHDRLTLASTVDVMAAVPGHGGSGPSANTEAAVAVEVSLERHISMPTCGAVSGPEFATEPVWHVETVEVAG